MYLIECSLIWVYLKFSLGYVQVRSSWSECDWARTLCLSQEITSVGTQCPLMVVIFITGSKYCPVSLWYDMLLNIYYICYFFFKARKVRPTVLFFTMTVLLPPLSPSSLSPSCKTSVLGAV